MYAYLDVYHRKSVEELEEFVYRNVVVLSQTELYDRPFFACDLGAPILLSKLLTRSKCFHEKR